MSEFHVDLDTLRAILQVEEGGQIVHYNVHLAPDRSDALVDRVVYGGVSGEAIENKSALMTLDQLRGDKPHDVEWAKAAHVVWAARGMWGIPLEFGTAEESAKPAREALNEAPSEQPAPKRKRS